ncbi:hypothetical protein BP00DRAFT_267619 [Aspergillus indologenus CBS 114.80]|uniref:Uncharacterized protein n=1 Tax=Aspergillus indologenus CBS 114.80 TaxID=1450541 RepID=A0A2V5JFZ2_9EURO|nr:hypothetical protein BP00DRAFT_267619 [Aspergillus indologenus CBS 114.80]
MPQFCLTHQRYSGQMRITSIPVSAVMLSPLMMGWNAVCMYGWMDGWMDGWMSVRYDDPHQSAVMVSVLRCDCVCDSGLLGGQKMSQEHWLPQFAPAPARQGSECVADIHGYCKEFGYTTYTQSQNQHHSTQANMEPG